ncbi:MAG: hypothetical protein LQ349_007915, partial [Xanthoria aureola]
VRFGKTNRGSLSLSSGGLGMHAIMWANALGADVYVLSHSPDKEKAAKDLGAKEFISTVDKDWAKPWAFTFNFMLNTADATHQFDLAAYLGTLAVNGQMHHVGLPDKPLPELKAQMFAPNGCSMGGSHIGSRPEMFAMLKLASEKKLKPIIETIPVSEDGCKKAVLGVHNNEVRYRYTLTDFDKAFPNRAAKNGFALFPYICDHALVNFAANVNIMRLLVNREDGDLSLEEFDDSEIPRYAILSHTWGADGEEVSFKNLLEAAGNNKAGYKKLSFCRDQAGRDDLNHFWVDTCCIDKSSSAELTEAINSMYCWYQRADKCYVYLSDVSTPVYPGNADSSTATWETAFRQSRWFRRGWTLQELIAPASVEFFSREGVRLGDKRSMEQTIVEITKIPAKALRGASLTGFEVEERMSWAHHRDTKKPEDGAYSLLGLFDVHIPLIYGEGRQKAFVRLREEISKSSKLYVPNTSRDRYFIVSKDISTKHVERRDLLVSLENHLTANISRACGGKRFALVGMSGSGKTELAARYAKLHRHDYEAVLWLDCSNERSLDNSFTRIAERLSQTSFQDSRRCRSFCQNWLCDHNGWLLIADGLDEDETLENFQTKFLSVGMEGSILATSTNFSLALAWSSLEVGNLSLSEGLELLRNILGNSLSRPGNGQDELRSLVEDFGYLVLAINQAGCYIRQQALTAAEYRRLLQEQGSSSLLQGSILPYPSNHYSRLWTAFELSFQRLEEADQRASQLLFLFTMLKSEEIEIDLLLSRSKFQGEWAENGEFQEVPQIQKWIPREVEGVFHERHVLLEAVAGLRRFALIRLNETDMSISLHPLIQTWASHRMHRHQGLVDSFKICATGVVCSKLIKQDLFPPFFLRANCSTHVEERNLSQWPWRQYRRLSRHALQCLQYICKLPRLSITTASQGLALLQFLEYSSFRSYEVQYALGQEVLTSVERSCNENPLDGDDFLRLSISVWRLIRARLSNTPATLISSPPSSWIERYLVAITAFERITLRQDANHQSDVGEQDLTQAVSHFRQLQETESDEYRRSLWHLTTYWWHQRLWSRIINALEPLVEKSLEQPVSDWSHERCIIRLVSALEKLDRRSEARRIMSRVKEAYDACDKSLRTLQNNPFLSKVPAERLNGETSHLPLAISPLSRAVPSYDSPTFREPWQVFIRDFSGRTYTLDAYPYMMVDDLLTELGKKIQEYHSMRLSFTDYRFIFGGKQLESH